MPPVVPSPIHRRRRLGIELRRLREAAGLTGDQVIERVGWASASKLSRLENGRSRPDLQDILALLDVYQATDEVREELTEITKASGDIRGWLRSYPVMTQQQLTYAELEAGCAEIREYSQVMVPGLLQTSAYARVRILSTRMDNADVATDESETEKEVAARLARQSLLNRSIDAPSYLAILEEAALGQRAGPAEMMREQVIRLCELAQLPHVTLQLLPRDAQIRDWYLPPTSFSLYRFADPQDPETLAFEGDFLQFLVSDRNHLDRYKMAFEWLRQTALSPADTLSWLSTAASRASGGPASPISVQGPATAPAQRGRPADRLTER